MLNSQKKQMSRQFKNPAKLIERIVQIKRVTKVCKGGKKITFRIVAVVGDEISKVGLGVGKADSILNAINKAITNAKKDLIVMELTKIKSINHLIIGNFGACKVLIKPASEGTGVIAGSSTRTILELAGVKNILTKQLGSNNVLNNAHATINALKNLKTPTQIASNRNIPLENFYTKNK
jgi:small subunit ribosomal protein S5